MITLNDITLFAAQNHQSMRMRDAFSDFTMLFDALTEEQRNNYFFELANLYLKFKPPIASNPKKMKPLELLSKFVAKKDNRECLNYIYVNQDGYATASTGAYLVTTVKPVPDAPGFYDPKTLVNIGDLDGTKYPSFASVLKPSTQSEPARLNDIKEIAFDGPIEKWRLSPADLWFDSMYVKMLQKYFGVDRECEIVLKPYLCLRMETEQFKVVLMSLN